jgi:hypothetical protein
MGRFRRRINDLALKEIQLHGRKFTWSNGQGNPTLLKLDRALYSVDWEALFPDCLLQSSATLESDHCPLILGLRDLRGERRFHSSNSDLGWMGFRTRFLQLGPPCSQDLALVGPYLPS